MKKLFAALVLSLLPLTTFPQTTKASLITVNGSGEVIFNVLSSEDQLALSIPERKQIEVKEIAAERSANNSSISLSKEDGKIYLRVGEGEGAKEMDVTTWQEDLVEIEEREGVKRIEILVEEEKFAIKQDEISAQTEYPISIKPEENKLSIETPSGEIYLSVFPVEAVESALRSRYVTRLPDRKIGISEKETGILTYEVDGERQLGVLDFLDYGVPVTVHVSASTGEVVSVDQPTLLRVFGFLFI